MIHQFFYIGFTIVCNFVINCITDIENGLYQLSDETAMYGRNAALEFTSWQRPKKTYNDIHGIEYYNRRRNEFIRYAGPDI